MFAKEKQGRDDIEEKKQSIGMKNHQLSFRNFHES